MQGAAVSPEMRKFAEAEFFPLNEGSMCPVPCETVTLRLGRGPHHAEEARPGPPDWSPSKETRGAEGRDQTGGSAIVSP